MILNQRGLDLIKSFEGLELTAYRDAKGVPTIGYGHTRTVTEQDVEAGRRITADQAEALLINDVLDVTRALSHAVKPLVDDGALNKNQWAAVVSLVFNIGIGRFQRSKAYGHLMNRDYRAFAFEAFDKEAGFTRITTSFDPLTGKPFHDYAGRAEQRPVPLGGLIRRRQAEQTLFETPVPCAAPITEADAQELVTAWRKANDE